MSSASFYIPSTNTWASPDGVGSRIEFNPDGTYTNVIIIQFNSGGGKIYLWTKGTYSVNGINLTLAETERYKNISSQEPLETKTYQWSIQEVLDPFWDQAWYTGPPTHTTLFMDDLSGYPPLRYPRIP